MRESTETRSVFFLMHSGMHWRRVGVGEDGEGVVRGFHRARDPGTTWIDGSGDNDDTQSSQHTHDVAATMDSLKVSLGWLGVILGILVDAVCLYLVILLWPLFQPNAGNALSSVRFASPLLFIMGVATAVAVACFTSLTPAKPSVSADSAPAIAHLPLGEGEWELSRSSARQYGDDEDLATGYWRKPSAFTLILTNRRLAVVRTESGHSAQTTHEDVDLRSITEVRAETIGTFPVLPIVRIRYQGALAGSVSQFGIRYESIEVARATADKIQAALVGV
jgi:hypothetical protein